MVAGIDSPTALCTLLKTNRYSEVGVLQSLTSKKEGRPSNKQRSLEQAYLPVKARSEMA